MKTKLVGKNKKIKEKRKIANRKNVPSSSSIVKFQTESPDVLRCGGCFQTHFPNRKLCMWYLRKHDYEEYKDEIKYENKPKIDISINGVVRLRGGANRESSFPVLVKRAIQSAKKHGINLKPGTINKGDGNCAFDSIISNINDRPCFPETLELSESDYRQVWITEFQMESFRYPELGAGIQNKKEKHSGTN